MKEQTKRNMRAFLIGFGISVIVSADFYFGWLFE